MMKVSTTYSNKTQIYNVKTPVLPCRMLVYRCLQLLVRGWNLWECQNFVGRIYFRTKRTQEQREMAYTFGTVFLPHIRKSCTINYFTSHLSLLSCTFTPIGFLYVYMCMDEACKYDQRDNE